MNHDRNHRLCQLFLKRRMRRLRRKGELEAANEIATVLNDELMLCAVCCEVEDQANQSPVVTAGGFAFLAWLLANWETIAALIKTLIELFSQEDDS